MMSAVLSIETSGPSCSVACVRGSDSYSRRAVVGNAHSRHVLEMVRSVLSEASLPLDRCDAIAYAAGPGAFTGLRVACAVAQGLAFGSGLPVVPVGTLEAIAHSVLTAFGEPAEALIAVDARMGEVYWALISGTRGNPTLETPPALASPATLRRDLMARGKRIRLGGGNAWAVHGDAMNDLVEQVMHRDAADAVDVAQLGRIAFEAGKAIAPQGAGLLYVRDDVASTTAEREARQRIASSSPPHAAQRKALAS